MPIGGRGPSHCPASLASRPARDVKLSFAMTLRRFGKPAFSIRYTSLKHMHYGYRGPKILNSVSLRFQDFQRVIY